MPLRRIITPSLARINLLHTSCAFGAGCIPSDYHKALDSSQARTSARLKRGQRLCLLPAPPSSYSRGKPEGLCLRRRSICRRDSRAICANSPTVTRTASSPASLSAGVGRSGPVIGPRLDRHKDAPIRGCTFSARSCEHRSSTRDSRKAWKQISRHMKVLEPTVTTPCYDQ